MILNVRHVIRLSRKIDKNNPERVVYFHLMYKRRQDITITVIKDRALIFVVLSDLIETLVVSQV